ncbi:MAG: CoA-binding protein, partial [Planctomycetota bacterium]
MPDIDAFLAAERFAVAGASNRTHKYGYLVFKALLDSGRDVYPLNPAADEIAGKRVYRSILEVPEPVDALSIITPPEVTREVVTQAVEAGVQHIWMQPGAEHVEASQLAREAGVNVI